MMWKCFFVNNTLHPESHILLIEINELCVSPDRIWPSINVLRNSGNVNVQYLVNRIVPIFCSPTVIMFFGFRFLMRVTWFDAIHA